MALTLKQEAFVQMDEYYVYALSDPESGKPFYIGKGKGSRAFNHFRDYKNGKITNGDKHNAIKAIKSKGLEPLVVYLHVNLTEEDALHLEWVEIDRDRHNLTNIVHGSASRISKFDAMADDLNRRMGTSEYFYENCNPDFLSAMRTVFKTDDVFGVMQELNNSIRLI